MEFDLFYWNFKNSFFIIRGENTFALFPNVVYKKNRVLNVLWVIKTRMNQSKSIPKKKEILS